MNNEELIEHLKRIEPLADKILEVAQTEPNLGVALAAMQKALCFAYILNEEPLEDLLVEIRHIYNTLENPK